MSEFTIITRGIAASYMKDEAWKVLFPFNECHTLRLRVGNDLGLDTETDTKTGIPLGEMGVRIEISVTEPLTRTAKGDDYDDFLDLTGAGVHQSLTTRFELSDMNAVLMSIDSAQFSPFDHTDHGYRLVNRDGSNAGTAFQKTGDSGKAVIEGTELTITVTGPSTNFSMVFTEGTTIVFDNNCIDGSESAFGDIDMLYDVICDGDESTIRYMLQEDAAQLVASAPSATGAVAANGTVSTTEAPVKMMNPGRGLPCNMFQISKPNSLPS